MYESTYIHTVQLTVTSCSHTRRHRGLNLMLRVIFMFLPPTETMWTLKFGRKQETIFHAIPQMSGSFPCSILQSSAFFVFVCFR